MLELNKIYNEDCLEGMKKIESGSVDMILCDLPYGLTAPKWDVCINIVSLWKEYNRIIKANRNIVLFATQPFTTKLIMSNEDSFKYCWYWVKNQATNFFHASRMPTRKIEEICVFNDGLVYNPQFSKGHVPTQSAKGCSNGSAYHGTNKRNYIGGSTVRFPTNVLEFDCVNNYKRIHSSEKPVSLCEYLIKTYTNEGETVLDSCMGSGTTAIACINTNRNFIGFELDKEYFDKANKRILHTNKPLF